VQPRAPVARKKYVLGAPTGLPTKGKLVGGGGGLLGIIVTLKTLLLPCVVGGTFVARVEEKLSSETSYDTLLTGEPAPKKKVKVVVAVREVAVVHCVILATVGVGKFGNTVAVATCCRAEVQPGLLGSSKSAK
jgi:hypothetical protein